MVSQESKHMTLPSSNDVPVERSQSSGHSRRVSKVTQARAKAQRAKLDAQTLSHEHHQEEGDELTTPKKQGEPQELQARRRTKMTLAFIL